MEAKRWEAWQFLLGEWIGEGGGQPGEGDAVFSFYPDLEHQILVRKSHMTFPATEGRPAFAHDDLIVVYQDPDQSTRAIYFDNEGHVIHYWVDAGNEGNAVTFVSEPARSAPRFRLSYVGSAGQTVVIRFEIAPPGQAEAFSVYTEGTARRK